MGLQQYDGRALVPRLVGPAILMPGVLALLPTLAIPQLENIAINDDSENAPHRAREFCHAL